MIYDIYIKNIINKDYIFNYYDSPVGGIFIISGIDSIKAIVFLTEQRSSLIRKNLKKDINDQIILCESFLDNYFGKISDINLFNIKCHYNSKSKFIELFIKKNNINNSENIYKLKFDVNHYTDNEISVYLNLIKVEYGKTISYKNLALNSGLINAFRFTGTTMAKNCFPIIIPCHRVIKSDGSLGNYSGGLDKKIFLLGHENVHQ